MSFNFIYNPLTNEKYSIFSYEGKSLLKQYIKYHQTGGMGTREPDFAIGPRGNVTLTKRQRQNKLLEHASTQAGINAVLQKTKSEKTQKIQKNQKKCRTLKFKMEQAQKEYYNTCDDETIEKNQREIQDANDRIPDFTNLGN